MILLCVKHLAGLTRSERAAIDMANALHRAGYPVTLLTFLGNADGTTNRLPMLPLDPGVSVVPLLSLRAEGGQLLHRNLHRTISVGAGRSTCRFTENQVAALRQLGTTLTADDTVVFTDVVQVQIFHRALAGASRQVRTVLCLRDSPCDNPALRTALLEVRPSIDRIQTLTTSLRDQLVPLFGEADLVVIPRFPSEATTVEARAPHEDVEVVLTEPFSAQYNQLDAVRALAAVEDTSVRLTFAGIVDNVYSAEVLTLARTLGVGDRVRIADGGLAHDALRSADVALVTTLADDFPSSLVEAARYGVSALAYDFTHGARDVIVDGQTGFIVPVGDVALLAARLTTLAGDAQLRARLGSAARDRFADHFSTRAVTGRYQHLLGSPPGTSMSLSDLFPTDGQEPIAAAAVSHRTTGPRRRRVHEVTVRSKTTLHDLLIEESEQTHRPGVRRVAGTTVLTFAAGGAAVISYTTSPGSNDRHYLANTTKRHTLEVLPYLRRDADYGDGSPPVQDTVFTPSTRAIRPTLRTVAEMLPRVVPSARRDIRWKLREIAQRRAAKSAAAALAPVAAAGPRKSGAASGTGRRRETLTSAMRSAVRLARVGAGVLASMAASSVVRPGPPARREVPRHPLYPVFSGTDNFGIPINTPGGVTVTNSGSPSQPTVSIRGEYDSVVLRDAVGERTVAAPFSYGEFFDRICAAEREYGLFDITTRDDIHVWELGRTNLLIGHLGKSFGFFGTGAPIHPIPPLDVYHGAKRLRTALPARRVVFGFPKRGGSDFRTAAFRDEETMYVVPPEPDGYPEVTDDNTVYPLYEYNRWLKSARHRWSQLRIPEVDARPFEEALTKALGMPVDIGDHLRNGLRWFLDEREFWKPIFERVGPEEVLITQSHSRPGLVTAAAQAGAVVSDIQYALTSRYHPTFWFGERPRHGATRFYTWSDFWAARTNAYEEHVVVPRRQPELLTAREDGSGEEPLWDVCIVSQPSMFRRMCAFMADLLRERPSLRVVIAPHPVQVGATVGRNLMDAQLAAFRLIGRVSISTTDTLTTIQNSEICVGVSSTSIYEAAALNRPTYVIPAPGYEYVLDDLELGLFRLATSPGDVVPFEVPALRRELFGS